MRDVSLMCYRFLIPEKHCSDCKSITSCSAGMELLKDPYGNRNTLKDAHCGYDGMFPKVC